MKKLVGPALLASLLLNAFLLLQRSREQSPPVVIGTKVIENRSDPEQPPEPEAPTELPAPSPVPEPRPATPVDPIKVTLIATPGYAEPGAEITVLCTVASGPPASSHWIGLFSPDAENRRYAGYQMARGATSTYVFKAPPAPGSYEFRYILGDNQTAVAKSNLVQVLGAPPARPLVELQVGSTLVRCGELIQARWSVHSGKRTLQDWIGLFAPDAKNENFLGWKYVADAGRGELSIKAPDQPGTYEFRYLLDNGYEPAAVSVRFTVVP